eukprot:5280206-Karenia_brevis.AAC.1
MMLSDGASRAGARKSAASWAVVACFATRVQVVCAGALFFETYEDSLSTELTGLELAVAAFLKATQGYGNVVPHA